MDDKYKYMSEVEVARVVSARNFRNRIMAEERQTPLFGDSLTEAATQVLNESARKHQRSARLLNEDAQGGSFLTNPGEQMIRAIQAFRDMQACVTPTDRPMVLTLDGYSGIEKPRYVSAALNVKREIAALAEELQCPPGVAMCVVQAATLTENEFERTDLGGSSKAEVYDFIAKFADLMRCSFEEATDILDHAFHGQPHHSDDDEHEEFMHNLLKNQPEWRPMEHDDEYGDDIWNCPRFAEDFVKLHQVPHEDEHPRYRHMGVR